MCAILIYLLTLCFPGSLVDVDSDLELMHLMDVDNVADISEVHAVFVFTVEYVDPADGGNIYLRNVIILSTSTCVTSQERNQH